MRNADDALYQAKKAGRNTYRVHNSNSQNKEITDIIKSD